MQASFYVLPNVTNPSPAARIIRILSVNKRLLALLNQRDYFRLETQLNLYKDGLDNKQRLYFQSFVDNAFNRNETSIKEIDTLLNNYSAVIN